MNESIIVLITACMLAYGLYKAVKGLLADLAVLREAQTRIVALGA